MCIMDPFLALSSQSCGGSALEYGSRSLRKLGSSCLGEDEDNDKKQDESSTKSGQENGEDDVTLKSFPVCDDRHLELILYLDRNLIYQMRLKLDLSLMEHYEKHCPTPEKRFNCLIHPPLEYKVPIKWPERRDEVWKTNIPHTHLAHEKSGQNWMIKKGEKIEFPGGGTHFHCGADKYIASIANMLNFSKSNLNNEDDHGERGSGLAPWPARLTAPHPQLADFGYSNEMFENDTEVWRHRVESYRNRMSKKIGPNTLRNANMRSFAAALKDKVVWV